MQKIGLSDKQLLVVLWIARLLLGATFVFSGFVKAVDPAGTGLKVSEYLQAWGMDTLAEYGVLFGFLLSTVEFMAGSMLLLAVSPITVSLGLLVIMLFMTPLTLYIAIANPVSDCGCFGEALHLTNWQTFGKNIVLLAAAWWVFRYRLRIRWLYHPNFAWVLPIFLFLFVGSVALRGYNWYPLFDFRPYKVGNSIVEMRQLLPGEEPDRYESTFVYERQGVRQEFDLTNYPANDTTWRFVEQRSRLVKKGATPRITDFFLHDALGDDVTDDVLSYPDFQFLVIAPNLETADDSRLGEINDLFDLCQSEGYNFYCVTSSEAALVNEWSGYTGGEYPYLWADETVLKTIIRANPGLILLKEGRILGKWRANDIPADEQMRAYLANVDNVTSADVQEGVVLRALLFYPLLVLTLLYLLQRTLMHLFGRFRLFRRMRRLSQRINPDNYLESTIEHLHINEEKENEKENRSGQLENE